MPIFMIGTQRSGSNLLRLMLNQLPEIAAPHPPHILQRLMLLASLYGDLARDENFRRLVDDTCKLVELNPVPWEGVRLDRGEVARQCRARSLVGIFGAVYDVARATWGKRDWCCKSLANVQYLREIEGCFGNEARYLYLYRDGRDVAVSFRKAVVGEKHFYHIARDWAATQQLALTGRERIGPKRFFSLSYEKLTSAPETSMRQLCAFLDVPFQDAMLDYHRSEEAKRAAGASALWGNVVNPVMSNNTNKFLKEASPSDIRVFELVAGDVLEALGYRRTYTAEGERGEFSAAELRQFDAENARLKQDVLDQVDPEDRKRRDQQAQLIEHIKSRPRAEEDVMWVNL